MKLKKEQFVAKNTTNLIHILGDQKKREKIKTIFFK